MQCLNFILDWFPQDLLQWLYHSKVLLPWEIYTRIGRCDFRPSLLSSNFVLVAVGGVWLRYLALLGTRPASFSRDKLARTSSATILIRIILRSSVNSYIFTVLTFLSTSLSTIFMAGCCTTCITSTLIQKNTDRKKYIDHCKGCSFVRSANVLEFSHRRPKRAFRVCMELHRSLYGNSIENSEN